MVNNQDSSSLCWMKDKMNEKRIHDKYDDPKNN